MKAFIFVATVIAVHFAVASTEPVNNAVVGQWAEVGEREWTLGNDEPLPQPESRNELSFDDDNDDFNEVFWTNCKRRGWEICSERGRDSCWEEHGCQRGGKRRCRWVDCDRDFRECRRHRSDDRVCFHRHCKKRCF
uniref:Uncharacterized protein n=1 Tax=Plectus sambesii TaxID=2011161 RepID=A0A914VSL9_9BILA